MPVPDPDRIKGGDLSWPLTWRYNLMTPWGLTQQEISADAPALAGFYDQCKELGRLVWTSSVATATTDSLELVSIDTVVWKVASILPPYVTAGTKGNLAGSSTGRDETPVIVQHTGHIDSEGRRRLFVPCTPADWVRDHMLTRDGAEGMQELGRGMYLGMGPFLQGVNLHWLNRYPRMFEGDAMGLFQVGFRYVDFLRVCQYTERMPDLSMSDFPY